MFALVGSRVPIAARRVQADERSARPEAGHAQGTAETSPGAADRSARWPANALAGHECPPPGPAGAAYMNQTWPAARLLAWAYPGEGGRRRDGWDPANWREYPSSEAYKAGAAGKPATAPPDEQTDVLLPDGPTRYAVFMRDGRIRHATVGQNAELRMFHGYATGNVWVKQGGRIELAGVLGSKHTFIRSDTPEQTNPLGGDWNMTKTPGASVELIGRFEIADRCFVKSGRMILGPGSVFKSGGPRDHRAPVFPGAELVLLSGARFTKTANQGMNLDISLGGTLLAGLPECPLTEDCFLELSYKPRGRDGNTASFATDARADDRGMVVLEGGDIQVHSTDPRTARLVIRWHGLVDEEDDAEILSRGGVPHRIDVVILEDIRLNGVLFDHFRKGGIELADPAVRATWKNIFFGEHNEGTPDELFRQHEHAGTIPYRL